MSDTFNRDYFFSHCGDEPYLQSSEVWKAFFRPIADAIALGLRPRRVFDAGCAVGFLVEALWDRGIEAHGRDISEFAISEVRADVRPWCEVGSIAAPIPGSFDLVLCIEVVEHMPEDEAVAAISNITSVAPRVLFSSSPTDLEEETHINVRPTRYWLERFADCGFAPVVDFDATFLTPHAVLFERSENGHDDRSLTAFSEIVRQRLRIAALQRGKTLENAKSEAERSTWEHEVQQLQSQNRLAALELAKARSERDELLANFDSVRSDAGTRLRAAERELKRLEAANSSLQQVTETYEERLRQAAHDVDGAARKAAVAIQQAGSHNRQRNKAAVAADEVRQALTSETEGRRLLALRLQVIEASPAWRIAKWIRRIVRHVPGSRRFVPWIWWSLTLRLGEKRRARQEETRRRNQIIESGFFDADFYLRENPSLVVVGLDPLTHYMHQGWREGRRPSPAFDPQFYVRSNPDLADLGSNPLIHYIELGSAEGRTAVPAFDPGAQAIRDTGLFDEAYYLANYPDIEAAGLDPAAHFATHGWKEARWPNADFDTEFYLESNSDLREAGVNPLLHYVEFGLLEGRPTQRLALTARHTIPDGQPSIGEKPARDVLASFAKNWAALPVFIDRKETRTINVVTDSVDSHSLFGGVGTSIIVGAFLAARSKARLRLVTRTNAPDPTAVGRILELHKINWRGPTDFAYIPIDGSSSLAIGEDDIFLTTSWWSTQSALQSIKPSQILYLLQEDERMFYPFGDVRLQCSETLSRSDVRLLINTELLFDHMAQGAEPIPHVRERGNWFEPAFPTLSRPTRLAQKDKLDFFFYARPTNDRNLFWRGLEVIETAIQNGVLAPDQWNFHFVGRNIPDLTLPGNIRPIVSERLPWSEYASLVAKMDLGLCLMYTPHPSYPPLDLAASGAIVVTNTHGLKTSLSRWSDNILAVPPNVDTLSDAIKRAAVLSRDKAQRATNCANDRIARDWNDVLEHVVTKVVSDMSMR